MTGSKGHAIVRTGAAGEQSGARQDRRRASRRRRKQSRAPADGACKGDAGERCHGSMAEAFCIRQSLGAPSSQQEPSFVRPVQATQVRREFSPAYSLFFKIAVVARERRLGTATGLLGNHDCCTREDDLGCADSDDVYLSRNPKGTLGPPEANHEQATRNDTGDASQQCPKCQSPAGMGEPSAWARRVRYHKPTHASSRATATNGGSTHWDATNTTSLAPLASTEMPDAMPATISNDTAARTAQIAQDAG